MAQLKMTIKLGQDEIKEAIRQYVERKIVDKVIQAGPLKITMIIHNSWSDQRENNSNPGSAEAEIEVPIEA